VFALLRHCEEPIDERLSCGRAAGGNGIAKDSPANPQTMFEREVCDASDCGVVTSHSRIGPAILPGWACHSAKHPDELEPVRAQEIEMLDEPCPIVLVAPDTPKERCPEPQKRTPVVLQNTTDQADASSRRGLRRSRAL
jgi:hypothetical protein